MPYAAPQIIQNPDRLQILRDLLLLDSPEEEPFDRLTALASKIVGAPVSLVSLIDADRQFFKSALGLPEPWASDRETPLSHSFCQHVVATGQPLVITDAREHPLVYDNLAIPDLNVIGYLGIPLETSDGYGLGSFCVIDGKPREWTTEEVEIMRDLAQLVMTEIELRSELIARKQVEEKLRTALADAENARRQLYRITVFAESTIRHTIT
ncbi:MAG: GAF domain-containing protein, partial [Chitinophagaceae bacterium]|nr:GAF domain-containing protein [Anaerolineae bacterium]